MLTNDMNNEIKRQMELGKMDFDALTRKYEQDSRNSGSIISGLFDIFASGTKAAGDTSNQPKK